MPYQASPKYTRLLRRKLARRARAIECSLSHDEARAALTQLRSIRERLNRKAA